MAASRQVMGDYRVYTELGLFIDGAWITEGREREPVLNPVTGKTLGHVPHATRDDLDRAVASAQKGFAVWRAMNAYERRRILGKAADIVRGRLEEIARILVQEEGKSIAEARVEVGAAADVLEWMGEEGRRAYGRIIPGRVKNVRQMVTQEPVGIVAAFSPWNFPATTPVRKMAGALGAGCALILKPSEETPGTAIAFVRALEEAGLPKGVLNLIFGVPSDISEYLIARPEVRKVSFTGSVAVGKHLGKLCAEHMKRSTMELGGHAPVVVFDDIDIEKSAEGHAAWKYRNAGQVCIAPTRFFVQENAYKRYLSRFVEATNALVVGDGLEANTQMGPLANPRRLEAMERIVEEAAAAGAKIAAGGRRKGNQGYFFEPTVVTDADEDSQLMTSEPFGPIAVIAPFKSFDEVVERANRLPYGLAAYAFTGSSSTAIAIGDALQAGMVGVNSFAISNPETPFGGIKDSGYGHEGSIEGLEAYMVKKFISQA